MAAILPRPKKLLPATLCLWLATTIGCSSPQQTESHTTSGDDSRPRIALIMTNLGMPTCLAALINFMAPSRSIDSFLGVPLPGPAPAANTMASAGGMKSATLS